MYSEALTKNQIDYLTSLVRKDREESRTQDGRAQTLPAWMLGTLLDADGIIIVRVGK